MRHALGNIFAERTMSVRANKASSVLGLQIVLFAYRANNEEEI